MITPESEPHVPQAPVPEARRRDPGTVTRLDGGPATTVRDSGGCHASASQPGTRSRGCRCYAPAQSVCTSQRRVTPSAAPYAHQVSMRRQAYCHVS